MTPGKEGRFILARYFSNPFVAALLLWIVIFAVAGLAADLVLMPYLAGRFAGKGKVPELAGLSPEAAKQKLADNGLLYMQDSLGDYSNDVAAGRILSQYPGGGTEVKRGRRIWVKVSKGAARLEVPVLRGLSLRQAELTLRQLGFKVGQLSPVQHSAVPPGAVIGTSPAARTAMPKGGKVNIQYSADENTASASVPALTGLSLDQAKALLAKLNLELGKVRFQSDKRNLPNTVLSQQPAPGEPIEGQAMDLVVSK